MRQSDSPEFSPYYIIIDNEFSINSPLQKQFSHLKQDYLFCSTFFYILITQVLNQSLAIMKSLFNKNISKTSQVVVNLM